MVCLEEPKQQLAPLNHLPYSEQPLAQPLEVVNHYLEQLLGVLAVLAVLQRHHPLVVLLLELLQASHSEHLLQEVRIYILGVLF